MLHLIVARQRSALEWLDALPSEAVVTVYNGGEPIETSAFSRPVHVHPVPAELSCVGVFLHHLQRTQVSASDDITVFTPEEPLRHAPAFFELLEEHAQFGALQVLSSSPNAEAAADGPPVRGEHFSLNTLAPIAHQQDEALRVGKAYRRKHALPDTAALLAHFFGLIGLPGLADQARGADIGVRAHGAMVAVRGDHLAQTLSQLQPCLETLRLLLRADRNYPQVIEHAWLHLLGQPFVTLAPLTLPQPAAAVHRAATPSMARVVASIDAVLAQSGPRGSRGAAPLAAAPVATAPPAAAVPTAPEGIAVLRQRAQAAFLRGESSTAWELLLRALDLAPRDIGLLADATQMAYAQQDTERALHCARRALAVEPDHVDCLFTLGMCLAATGQAEEALGIFERLNHGELAAQWQERQQAPVQPALLRRVPQAA